MTKTEIIGSVEVILPSWEMQIKLWDTENPDWWANFKSYLDSRQPSNVRGDRAGRMDWTPERFCELVYIWNNYPSITANEIAKWWVKRKLLKPDSLGPVEGMIRRLTARAITTQRANSREHSHERPQRFRPNLRVGTKSPLLQRFRSAREIVELRRKRVEQSGGAFDTTSREERGLPSTEMARQQHPDHAEGITYSTAHRLEHGRTIIFSEEDRKLIGALRRLMDLSSDLNKIIPEDFQFPLSQYLSLKPRDREMAQIALMKLLPRLRILISTIENLPTPDEEVSKIMPG